MQNRLFLLEQFPKHTFRDLHSKLLNWDYSYGAVSWAEHQQYESFLWSLSLSLQGRGKCPAIEIALPVGHPSLRDWGD